MTGNPTSGPELLIAFGIRSWLLVPGEAARIGRGAEARIVVEHPLVSRVHAYIFYDDGWWIQDEGSLHGLWADGAPIRRWKIQANTVVGLGDPALGAPQLRLNVTVPCAEQGGTTDELNHASTPNPSTVIRIGRGLDSDFPLQDVLASRHHAVLRVGSGSLTLEDLGSLNGTYVNGRRISGTVVIRGGDRLTFGNSDFQVRADGWIPLLNPLPVGVGLVLEGVGYEVRVRGEQKTLLKDVEFEAGHGQLWAVIGPSGAGKSTLMSVMTGANAPSSGSVWFDGQDINKNFEALRSRIGFVPQEDIVHRTLTVRQALCFAGRLRLPEDMTAEERRHRADDVLTTLGLLEQADSRIDKLSGGQRKRASVALELLTEPALLILDEPTSGLDPAMDKHVMETLRTLADEGRVVIVVTHNVANLSVCDQVLVLARGGLPAYTGRSEALLSHFDSADWAEVFSKADSEAVPMYEKFRSLTPRRLSKPASIAEVEKPIDSLTTKRWLDQAHAIADRQLRLIISDRGYFVFLALLPIVLGILALVVPGSRGFGKPDPSGLGEPSQLLVVLIFGASFMGMALSARDLVGERTIFRREHAVGLAAGPYLLAKTGVFVVICVIQSAVMSVIVFVGKPGPSQHLLTAVPGLEIFIAIAFTACSCSCLGLLISASVRSTEQVMPLMVVCAMAQLVLSGGLIPVTARAGLEQVSWIAPTRWGFAAGASSIDLKSLVPSTQDDWLWGHDLARYGLSLAAMLVLSGLCWLSTYRRLTQNA